MGYRWGFELGYFHDPRAGFDDNEDFPHKDPDGNWPTQFSKGAGLSAQLFLYSRPNKKITLWNYVKNKAKKRLN